jgi:DnaJ-class molecular chaperone
MSRFEEEARRWFKDAGMEVDIYDKDELARAFEKHHRSGLRRAAEIITPAVLDTHPNSYHVALVEKIQKRLKEETDGRRTAFCLGCGGEGIREKEGKVCSVCHGTGLPAPVSEEPCTHESWEVAFASRKCADCGEWLPDGAIEEEAKETT